MTEISQRKIGTFIMRLSTSIQNAGMYPYDHPQVISMTVEAFDLLNQLLQDTQELTILLIGDYLAAGNKPLLLPDFYKSAFIRIMKIKGVEWISFLRSLPFNQFEDMVRSLASPGASVMSSTKFIKMGKIKLKDSPKTVTVQTPEIETPGDGIVNILDLETDSKEKIIRKLYLNFREQTSIDLTMVDRVVADLMVIIRESNPLRLLAKIKSHDEYTFTHSSNVGILSMALAEHLGFNEFHLNKIGMAALLHDIGKTTTPDEILLKKGPLTKEERTVMEEHTVKGAIYLMKLKGVDHLAILAALEHHIKYDGSGYPKIKGGWKPNIVSQIITIADVYDALRSIRPYREAMSHDQIIEVLLKESGSTFNPEIVKHFIKLIEK